MSDTQKLVTDLERYAGLIGGMLQNAPAFTPESESALALQVERGVVYASAIRDAKGLGQSSIARVIELSTSDRLASIAVVDRSGHHRPVYRGLLIYSCLQAFSLAYETLPRSEFGRWEEGLRPWCDLLEAELGEIEWPTGAMPAGRGSSATEAAWMALALRIAGKVYVRDAWTDLASDTFGKLTRSQRAVAQEGGRDAPGPFLLAGPSDNPEIHWYHELVLLHAAASYAVQTEDRAVAAAAARNGEWHLAENQPDHATNQPWAVFAFIWNPQTRSLADQLLHSASGHDSAISLMLLADTLYCLELFTK